MTINSVQPGMFDTDRLRGTTGRMAEIEKISVDAMRERRVASVPSRRFGEASELGNLVAFLASGHAGFITGQNILIDGGQFPGAF